MSQTAAVPVRAGVDCFAARAGHAAACCLQQHWLALRGRSLHTRVLVQAHRHEGPRTLLS
eukprot:704051-Rhodomonas_salina.1